MIKNDNNQKKSIFVFEALLGSSEGNSLCSADKRTVEERVNCELNREELIKYFLFGFIFGLDKVLPPVLAYLGTATASSLQGFWVLEETTELEFLSLWLVLSGG